MKKVKIYLVMLSVLLSALCAFAGCAGNSNAIEGNGDPTNSVAPNTPHEPSGAGDILVAYFSCTNTTKKVAETIAAVSGGALCRIIPAVPYTASDLDYGNNDCRANKEQNDPSARPEISGSVEEMNDYSVIFLGYPIWWGTLPKIIYTFMDAYDLSGKTVVPFCTSGGSGISASVSAIKSEEPDATVLNGLRFTSANSSETAIENWIGDLNIIQKQEGNQQ